MKTVTPDDPDLLTVSWMKRIVDLRIPPLVSGSMALSSPIWGMTTPPVIRSFLSDHDLSGKTLIPFVTHGGYGRGESMTVVAEHAPRSRLLGGFTMQADQERETLSQVTRWLGGIQIGK
jgi:hypothetical protein